MLLLSTQHLLSKESLLFYGTCTLPAGMSVYHTHAYCPRRPEDVGSSETGVPDGSKMPYVCRKSNLNMNMHMCARAYTRTHTEPVLLTTEPAQEN